MVACILAVLLSASDATGPTRYVVPARAVPLPAFVAAPDVGVGASVPMSLPYPTLFLLDGHARVVGHAIDANGIASLLGAVRGVPRGEASGPLLEALGLDAAARAAIVERARSDAGLVVVLTAEGLPCGPCEHALGAVRASDRAAVVVVHDVTRAAPSLPFRGSPK